MQVAGRDSAAAQLDEPYGFPNGGTQTVAFNLHAL